METATGCAGLLDVAFHDMAPNNAGYLMAAGTLPESDTEWRADAPAAPSFGIEC